MNCRYTMLRSGTLWFGMLFGIGPQVASAQAPAVPQQQPTPVQEGVEFLARGPIHEAFAEPTVRSPQSSPLVAKEPPKPIEELPPDQMPQGANVHWIPGYWAWNDDTGDFLWVSGTYRTTPPGRHWVPGYWNPAPGGWQWVAGFWAEQETNHMELLSSPPPEPVDEAIPPAPDAASIYQPGSWVSRENRYLWRSGFWSPYHADWTWTPASYVWTPGGYIFNDGFWDYPLRDRGLLFAPVNIDRRLWSQPGWLYRPSYVVHENFLLAALFVRPSCNHYYFGDYFDPAYDRLGFIPWTGVRHGRAVVDPLFSHYQAQFRAQPTWSRDQGQLYAERRQDPAARPPRTLIQQNAVIQTISQGSVAMHPVNNVKNMTALAPLRNVDHNFVAVRPVTQTQQAESQRAAAQFKELSAERAKVTVPASKPLQPTPRPGVAPPPVKVQLPPIRPAPLKVAGGPPPKTPPAHPVMPTPAPHTTAGPSPVKHPEVLPPARPPDPKPAPQPTPLKLPEKKSESTMRGDADESTHGLRRAGLDSTSFNLF